MSMVLIIDFWLIYQILFINYNEFTPVTEINLDTKTRIL